MSPLIIGVDMGLDVDTIDLPRPHLADSVDLKATFYIENEQEDPITSKLECGLPESWEQLVVTDDMGEGEDEKWQEGHQRSEFVGGGMLMGDRFLDWNEWSRYWMRRANHRKGWALPRTSADVLPRGWKDAKHLGHLRQSNPCRKATKPQQVHKARGFRDAQHMANLAESNPVKTEE